MPAEPTYTYSSNPATDSKDAVRALLADHNKDGKGWMLSDEEILWALSTEGGTLRAAAACAEMIAGQFTGPKRNITLRTVGDLRIQSGSRGGASEDWYALARTLRNRANRSALPISGGVDLDDRFDRLDRSLLQPEFVRGMDDYLPNSRNDLDGVTPPLLP